MNWEEDFLNDLTKLQLDYYDKGINGYTVAPNADARPIIDKVSQLLKEQRQICWQKFHKRYIGVNEDEFEEIILNAPEPKGDKL